MQNSLIASRDKKQREEMGFPCRALIIVSTKKPGIFSESKYGKPINKYVCLRNIANGSFGGGGEKSGGRERKDPYKLPQPTKNRRARSSRLWIQFLLCIITRQFISNFQ